MSSGSSCGCRPTSPTASTCGSSTPSRPARTTPATGGAGRRPRCSSASPAAKARTPARRCRRRWRTGRGPNAVPAAAAAPAGGRVIAERRFDEAAGTDDAWVTLAPFSAADGEAIDGSAWLRLDVIGEAGDYGNAFTVEVSLSPDRSDPAPGVALFSYQPTVRWREGERPDRGALRRSGRRGAPPAELRRRRGRDRPRLDLRRAPAPGLRPGRVARRAVRGAGRPRGDHHPRRLGDPERRHARPLRRGRRAGGAGDAAAAGAGERRAPTAVASARPLANCTSVAFDASASTGDGPLAYRWRFGDGGESDAPVIAHPFAEPGHYEAELEVLGRGDGIGRGARVAVPVHVRAAPVAVAGDPVTAAPGEPVAFDGAASVPSDSPITRFHWSFGDGAEAEGAATTHAYERPGVYRADLRVEDDFGPSLLLRRRHPDRDGELPAGPRGRRGADGSDRRAGDARRRRELRRRRHDRRLALGHGRRHDARRRDRHPRLHGARRLRRDPDRHRRLRRRQRDGERHRRHRGQRPAGAGGGRAGPADRGRRDRPPRRARLVGRRRRDPLLVLGLRRRGEGRGAGGAVRLGRARRLSGDR